MWGRNFLKRKLSPPLPLFKEFAKGDFIICCYFVRSTDERAMFAPHPRGKVFSQVFFKKLAGLGRAHKNGVFFLPSFFFAPLVPKKKRYCGFFVFIVILCARMVFCKKIQSIILECTMKRISEAPSARGLARDATGGVRVTNEFICCLNTSANFKLAATPSVTRKV